MLFEAGLDKRRHPELEAAERPIADTFLGCVRAIADDGAAAQDLATAVEAIAHGHAMLLLDGGFGHGEEAVELAAERAARATLALVAGRHLLTGDG